MPYLDCGNESSTLAVFAKLVALNIFQNFHTDNVTHFRVKLPKSIRKLLNVLLVAQSRLSLDLDWRGELRQLIIAQGTESLSPWGVGVVELFLDGKLLHDLNY